MIREKRKALTLRLTKKERKKKKKVVLFLHCAPVVDTVNLIMSLNISLNRLHRPLTARKVEVKTKKYSDNQREDGCYCSWSRDQMDE